MKATDWTERDDTGCFMRVYPSEQSNQSLKNQQRKTKTTQKWQHEWVFIFIEEDEEQVCCYRNSIQLCHHCHYEWNTSLAVFAALGVQEKCHNWSTYCLMQTISGLYHTLSYYIVSHCTMQIMHHATGATVFSAAALQQGFEFESHPVLFCANLVAVFSSFLSSI